MGKFLYLVKVESNANNNKFYRMIENESDNTFEAQYGRIGNTGYQTKTYPMHKWSSTYKSKLRKGYEDKSDLVAIKIDKTKNKYKEIDSKVINAIVKRLQSMARQSISENYTVSSNNVTQKMIDEAQHHLDDLVSQDKLNGFNAILMELFKTIPRKMKQVSDYLSEDVKEFGKIIQREQELLDVMRGQVLTHEIEDNNDDIDNQDKINKTILEIMGLEFEEVTDEDVNIIKKTMGRDSHRFVNAWKVKTLETQTKFDKYTKENNIKDIRLLFHGTRSENVWSILKTGLVLRPTNAVITGKMFGFGLYASNDFDKSRGYTSISGSRWAHGGNNTGFMLLMDVAYGNPYNVYSFDSKYYSMDYNKLKSINPSYNCLHAHGGTGMLRKDEIVVYSESQITVKYLLEIS